MKWKLRSLLPLGSVVILLSSWAASQTGAGNNSEPPLGDVVKQSRKSSSPKAKTVITDDTLQRQLGPIPGIVFEGVDNSDEIIRAIREYRKNHAPAETEEVVRHWYNEFDTMMARTLDDNARLVARKEDRRLAIATGEYGERVANYSALEERRNGEIRADRDDFRRLRQNGLMMARIQQTFLKVRGDLQRCYLRYEWFKIRNGNGNGSF